MGGVMESLYLATLVSAGVGHTQGRTTQREDSPGEAADRFCNDMTNELFRALVQRLRPSSEGIHSVQITEDEIADLSREQAEEIVALYGATTLITLPRKEQEFFAWLQKEDAPIWNDLWGSDEQPYRVSLGYLPDLLPNRRGFLICDLVDNPNYYFTINNITAEDGSAYLDAAIEIVKNEGRLSMDQAFVVEVWRAPIDQWRFAYMYRQPLDEVKQMVQWLVTEGILTLPAEREKEENPPESSDAQ